METFKITLASPIMDLFVYIGGQISSLINLMMDSKVAGILGANFVYILIGILLFWVATNMFLIRPIGVPLVDIAVTQAAKDARERERDLMAKEREALKAERLSYGHYKEERMRREEYSARYNNEMRRGGGE